MTIASSLFLMYGTERTKMIANEKQCMMAKKIQILSNTNYRIKSSRDKYRVIKLNKWLKGQSEFLVFNYELTHGKISISRLIY